MMTTKQHLIALTLLGLFTPLLSSCAPSDSKLQSYAPLAAQPAGTARVWFLRTKDPQELEQGDPNIYANGNQVGRSIPGIAFYHDFPPGAYAFTVQALGGTPTRYADRVQLAPGTQTYLEILWGSSPHSRNSARCSATGTSHRALPSRYSRRSCRLVRENTIRDSNGR